jgi:hypothetical protein
MSEKSVNKRLGAKAQYNSGRGQHGKGDSLLGPFTIDIKEYTQSYSVSRKSWAKICTDAAKNGNTEPALFLCLAGEPGEFPVRLAVVGEAMFKEMLAAWEEKHGKA